MFYVYILEASLKHIGSGARSTTNMFYVYILKSQRDKKLYIGFTSDLRKRFKEHQTGLVASTKPRRPFEIVYYEAYKSEKEAKFREGNLKRYSHAYTQLKQRIKQSVA